MREIHIITPHCTFNPSQEIRLKLGFKLRLPDLLIKPIQRLTKYHMLLEAILKYSQRAGLQEEAEAIAKAFHVMTVVPNQANDMMDIGRLQGFEVCRMEVTPAFVLPHHTGIYLFQGKITAQGKLLHRGPLLCVDITSSSSSSGPSSSSSSSAANGPPKMKPYTVFLFEQIMIFSEIVGKKTMFTSPVYVYKAHFLVSERLTQEYQVSFLLFDHRHSMFTPDSACVGMRGHRGGGGRKRGQSKCTNT